MIQHNQQTGGIDPTVAQQQETEGQQLLNKVNANIRRQLEILTWLEANVPVWKELLSLRSEYAQDSDALSKLVKSTGNRVGPVFAKQVNEERYRPQEFITLALQYGWYQEMCSLGVITFDVDKDRAKEFLVRDSEAAEAFKNACFETRLKYVAAFGVPKQPDVVPVAESRKGKSTPPPQPAGQP